MGLDVNEFEPPVLGGRGLTNGVIVGTFILCKGFDVVSISSKSSSASWNLLAFLESLSHATQRSSYDENRLLLGNTSKGIDSKFAFLIVRTPLTSTTTIPVSLSKNTGNDS